VWLLLSVVITYELSTSKDFLLLTCS
jgi:hypothetical protein